MTCPITQERLRELFEYDAGTGELVWRKRPLSDFKTKPAFKTWNARFGGKAAGCRAPSGYLVVGLDDKLYQGHRLIFLWHHGCLPPEIDHINHICDDNRIENLRAADRVTNCRNQKLHKTNTSGRIGVYRHQGKWRVQIRTNGKARHLGYFDDFQAACAARAAAEAEFGFHKNHGAAPAKVVS